MLTATAEVQTRYMSAEEGEINFSLGQSFGSRGGSAFGLGRGQRTGFRWKEVEGKVEGQRKHSESRVQTGFVQCILCRSASSLGAREEDHSRKDLDPCLRTVNPLGNREPLTRHQALYFRKVARRKYKGGSRVAGRERQQEARAEVPANRGLTSQSASGDTGGLGPQVGGSRPLQPGSLKVSLGRPFHITHIPLVPCSVTSATTACEKRHREEEPLFP